LRLPYNCVFVLFCSNNITLDETNFTEMLNVNLFQILSVVSSSSICPQEFSDRNK